MEQQTDNVRTILSCATSLLDNLNSVLDYFKLEASTSNDRIKSQLLSVVKFDLNHVISNLCNMFKLPAEEKGIQLERCFSHSKISCEGDPVRIRSIVMNLLSNACKFTEKGKVMVHVNKLDHENVLIKVADSGKCVLMKCQGVTSDGVFFAL